MSEKDRENSETDDRHKKNPAWYRVFLFRKEKNKNV